MAPKSHLRFSEAGVAASGFPRAHRVYRSSRVVVRAEFVGFGWDLRIAAGDDFAGRIAHPGRHVALGPEFHAGLEFWRWFVDKGVDARGRVLSAPMIHLLERPAQRTLFSDA